MDHVVITTIICGYPGEDLSPLSEKQIAQQKERPKQLPRGEAFFSERWGEPFVDVD